MYSTVRHPWHWQYSEYSIFASLCHYLEAHVYNTCMPFSACYEHTHTTIHAPIHATHAHMHTLIHNPINPHLHTAHTQGYKPYALTVRAHKETHCTFKPTRIQLLLLTCSNINAPSWQCTLNACVHHGTSKSMTVYVECFLQLVCLSQCFVFHIVLINYSCMYLCIYCRCLWGRVSIR